MKHMEDIDFLGELVRLDSAPVDTSAPLLTPAAASVQLGLEEAPRVMEIVGQTVVQTLLTFLFGIRGGHGGRRTRRAARRTETLRKSRYARRSTAD